MTDARENRAAMEAQVYKACRDDERWQEIERLTWGSTFAPRALEMAVKLAVEYAERTRQ